MHPFEKQAWGIWLNCDPAQFDQGGTQLHANPKLDTSNQLITLVSRRGVNVSLPASRFDDLASKLAGLQKESLVSITGILMDGSFFSPLFGTISL